MTSLPVVDSPTGNAEPGSNRRKGRRSTREKIEKLVAEGAKNYPAYLKLIYTGDSEQSSEEEISTDVKNDAPAAEVRRETICNSATSDGAKIGAKETMRDGIMSPESEKLLDPGKEKPATPTETDIQGQGRDDPGKESSAEAVQFGVADDAKQSSEAESYLHMEEKWKLELFQLQDDIISLKAMLRGKLQIAAEIKQRLGISPMAEFKHSFLSLKDSGSFLKSLSAYASRKMGTIRNSLVFKSMEETVGKAKSRSMGQIISKLHRRLPSSKSESNVSEFKINAVESMNAVPEVLSQNSLTESTYSDHD